MLIIAKIITAVSARLPGAFLGDVSLQVSAERREIANFLYCSGCINFYIEVRLKDGVRSHQLYALFVLPVRL